MNEMKVQWFKVR